MAIADRKRREFEAREKMVVEHADELLLDRGYLGLNLDELADRVEYSKATLYHHFSSKEDLVLAV
ncbi:MAG: helix-turn-helix domain-containing protein, partial [Verrucomicrobiota bacterium]